MSKPVGAKSLNDTERRKIREMIEEFTLPEIAKELNRSHFTISDYLKRENISYLDGYKLRWEKWRESKEGKERFAKALQLRREGLVFREIGRKLGGVSRQRAHQLVAKGVFYENYEKNSGRQT